LNDPETETSAEQAENAAAEEAVTDTIDTTYIHVSNAFEESEPSADVAEDTTPHIPTNDEAAQRVSQLVTGVQKEREFEHTCFDPIPDDKVREMAEEMAQHLQEAADLENEAKEIAKDYKERIQSQERAAHAIGRRVTLNREEVVVLCTEYFDRDLGRAYVVRSDTFEVVVNRPLMQHERQLYMQFPAESEDGAADTGQADTNDGVTPEAAPPDGGEAQEMGTSEDSEADKALTPAQARKRAKALREAAADAAHEQLPAAA